MTGTLSRQAESSGVMFVPLEQVSNVADFGREVFKNCLETDRWKLAEVPDEQVDGGAGGLVATLRWKGRS